MEKKKIYVRPVLKSVDVELENVIAESLPISDEGTNDQYSKHYSGIWSCMKADDNAAASQQCNDDEEDF